MVSSTKLKRSSTPLPLVHLVMALSIPRFSASRPSGLTSRALSLLSNPSMHRRTASLRSWTTPTPVPSPRTSCRSARSPLHLMQGHFAKLASPSLHRPPTLPPRADCLAKSDFTPCSQSSCQHSTISLGGSPGCSCVEIVAFRGVLLPEVHHRCKHARTKLFRSSCCGPSVDVPLSVTYRGPNGRGEWS